VRILRWTWPVLLVLLLLVVSWGRYAARSSRRLDIAVADKTVPYATRVEHRSFFWLLRHLKIERPAGGAYDPDRDYLGAFPGPTPATRPPGPPSWTPTARGAPISSTSPTPTASTGTTSSRAPP